MYTHGSPTVAAVPTGTKKPRTVLFRSTFFFYSVRATARERMGEAADHGLPIHLTGELVYGPSTHIPVDISISRISMDRVDRYCRERYLPKVRSRLKGFSNARIRVACSISVAKRDDELREKGGAEKRHEGRYREKEGAKRTQSLDDGLYTSRCTSRNLIPYGV